MRKRKLVFGVGINDADYVTLVNERYFCEVSNQEKLRRAWICPYYSRWFDMVMRCYNEKQKDKYRWYFGICTVVPDWHYFTTFRAWMEKQDWEGKLLDKDLLVKDNKIYGPETCTFISERVNSFLTDRKNFRGEYPIGVRPIKNSSKFQANCSDPFTKKRGYLGKFDTPELAFKAWLEKKFEYAERLAAEERDSLVGEALINRFKFYEEENNV